MPIQRPSNPAGVTLFTKRRPDWQLPDVDDVHQGLMLTGIDNDSHVELMSNRVLCEGCGKTRTLFCYECRTRLMDGIPTVNLPFTFSIVTHHAERVSKNTGVHAAVLAQPGQVLLHDIAHCPQFDKATAVVLFPCDSALRVEDLDPGTVTHALIIDSKWQKATELLNHPVLEGVRRVKLTHTRSAFWRHHTRQVAEEGVCTVEAMLHFVRSMLLHGKLAPDQLPPSAVAAAPAAAPAATLALAAPSGPQQPLGTAPAVQTAQAVTTNNSNEQRAAAPSAQEQKPLQEAAQAGAHGNGSCADANHAVALGTGEGLTLEGAAGAGTACSAVDPALDVAAAEHGACGEGIDEPGTASCATGACRHVPGWHAWMICFGFFVLQHRHIQAVAERRLQEHVGRKQDGGAGGGAGEGAEGQAGRGGKKQKAEGVTVTAVKKQRGAQS